MASEAKPAHMASATRQPQVEAASGLPCPYRPFRMGFLRFLARAFALFALLLAILLMALGLLVTAVFARLGDDGVLQESLVPLFLPWPSSFLRMLPALALACAEAALLRVVWRHVRVSPAVLCGVVCAILLVAQLAWVGAVGSQGFGYADTRYLVAGGEAIASGDLAPFREAGLPGFVYENLRWYPFQAGGCYLFSLFFRPGAASPYMAFQVSNAVCNTGTAAALFGICHMLTDDERAQRVVCTLLLVCLPLVFSCTFVYGNAIGLFFSVLASLLLMHALREGAPHRAAAAVGCCAAIVVGRVAKSTVTLFFIPLALVAVMAVLERRSLRAVAGTVALIAVTMLTSSIPVRALEAQAGTDFGRGLPTISWIAMGLDYDGRGMPGWWTAEALITFEDTGGDYDAQSTVAKNRIREDGSHFASNPKDAARFFGMKLATEWANPTYQSIYYSTCSEPAPTGAAGAVVRAAAEYDNPLGWHLDAYQLLVYVGFLLYARELFRARDIGCGELVPVLAILAGAFVYLLWEAKSVYVLPYFMMMVPLAAVGLSGAFERHARRASGKDRGKAQEEAAR